MYIRMIYIHTVYTDIYIYIFIYIYIYIYTYIHTVCACDRKSSSLTSYSGFMSELEVVLLLAWVVLSHASGEKERADRRHLAKSRCRL